MVVQESERQQLACLSMVFHHCGDPGDGVCLGLTMSKASHIDFEMEF